MHPQRLVNLPGPIVLLGAGGMLHRAWEQLLCAHDIPCRSLGLAELDLTRPQSIDPALADARLVINCAAYTDVDGAEADEPSATAVNGTGVGHLARCCNERHALLVHYSTDYVFSGAPQGPRGAPRPYRPQAPRAPLGAYGRSKALGEVLLEQAGGAFLLIRTSWLYAPWGKNFVRTIAQLVGQRKPLKIVNDQTGRPTSAEHLASSTLRLLEQGARGVFHVTDGGQCTWFEFAGQIARHMDPQASVLPCTTAELGRPAQRPAYSVLDLEQTEALLGPMPDWKENLAKVMERLE